MAHRQGNLKSEPTNMKITGTFSWLKFFRDNYEISLKNLPNVNSGVQINQISVYVTNRTNASQNLRNVVALTDLGDDIVNPTGFFKTQSNPNFPFFEFCAGRQPKSDNPDNYGRIELWGNSKPLWERMPVRQKHSRHNWRQEVWKMEQILFDWTTPDF